MQILGQYDLNGEYREWRVPRDVVQFGNTLRDKYGLVWGIKDGYDDWVSPTLYAYGIKAVLKVIEIEKGK